MTPRKSRLPFFPARVSIPLAFPVAVALRRTFAQGYGKNELRADLLAGCVVGIVALPLSMALAIACGVPPQHGLYTAIAAGSVAALPGGSPVPVTGPTAAFVVVLTPLSARFGLAGPRLATAMAGLILIAMALGRLGRLIEFVPNPVTSGFTLGIAVVIATLQLRDLLGLRVAELPERFLPRLAALARALPSLRTAELAIGLLTLALLVSWPRISTKVPAPLVALAVAAAAAALLARAVPGRDIATIGSRFPYELDGVRHAGIPRLPPLPLLPWRAAGPDGQQLALSFGLLRDL